MTELTTLPPEARAAVALKSSQTEIDLRALAIKNVNITQVIDKPGREQAHGAAMEIKRSRVSIEKIAKEARDDATKFSKAVITEEKRLIAIIEPEEVRLLGLRDGWDAEQERIRCEKEEAERRRVQALHNRIDEIKGYVTLALECRTSARVKELIDEVATFKLDNFDEFSEDVAVIHAGVLKRMEEISDAKIEEEKERARAKAEQEAAAEALRIEREAFAVAQAEAKRIADQNAAKVRAEAEAMAAQRAVFETEQEASRQALVAEAKRIADERAALDAVKTKAVEIAQPATAPLKTSASRPTDSEIIEVLSLHYRVHESKVVEWLLDMDIEAASAAMATEFV